MKFRVSDGTQFFLIGERKTIFVESLQQVFEVDDLTAYLTCALAEPTSFRQLKSELVMRGVSQASAGAYVRNCLLFWSRQRVLDIVLDEDDGQPLFTQTLDLAGTAVSIICYDEKLIDIVRPVFDHQAGRGDPGSISYELAKLGNWVCISKNRSKGMIVKDIEAAPALKALMTDDVLAGLGTDVALHAALLVKNSRGLLICGAPGAGKTTLAVALMEAGFECGGDDLALLDDNGALRGVPFAPALKPGSWNLFSGIHHRIMSCPIHRRLDSKRVRYLAPVPYAPRKSVALDSIVLLRRRKKGPALVSQVEPTRALSEVLAGAFTPTRRLDLMQFQRLVNAVSKARVIELTFSRLDEAAEILSRHHDGK
ncbi:serine kinase [Sinorhizobium fredii]|uniref:Serine kinase n=1 Tax=Rhizobium fredii TaxID=380 RepID=A0A2A6M6U1_RHIFR|nr:serine kinase [Sinorhizobium fredii]PDT50573.1 serine kinase [Sinorhizobium fredii]